MKPSRTAQALLLAFGVCAGSVALADETIAPEPQVQNGITYLTGGIGEDQAQAMRAESKKGYNLQLVFATEKSGQYQANVSVTITDAKGEKLIDLASVGPGFYAKLPAGHYKVVAENHGTQQHKSIAVTENNLTRYVLYWAAEPGELKSDMR